MSTKEELQLWIDGAKAYKQGDLETALLHFEPITSLSKVAFNVGMIYTRFNDHASADMLYSSALASDPFLAVAFLQKAYAYFMLEDYSRAERCYNKLFELLRENDYIDYAQLGLKYRLYRCEVHFNKAMCAFMSADNARGVQGIAAAQKCARSADHQAIIASAARGGINDITLFTVPYEAIFEVPECKVKNLDQRSFMKDAKVVITTDENESFAGFTGAAILNPALSDSTLDYPKGDDGKPAVALTILRRPTLASVSTAIPQSPTDRSPLSASQTIPPPRSRASSLPEKGSSSTISRSQSRPADNTNFLPRPSTRRQLSANPIMENDLGFIGRSNSTTSTIDRYNRDASTLQRSLPRSNTDPDRLTSPVAQQYSQRSKNPNATEFPFDYADKSFSSSLGRSTTSREKNPDMFKAKIHFEGRTFAINMARDIDLATFGDIVCSKQGINTLAQISYPDEDDPDSMITVGDDDDLLLAISSSKGSTVHFYCKESNDLLDFY
ncbi:hypothetical protein BDV3_001994 [Batrachochytrium dendrobatidis]|nr:hypothetical protein O5D80_007338 [Batrachochytrium dendrobatidis]KAK5664929.1 hypothetical protein QVD99_008467 [Batrachochytrium dendrobatidis]